LTPAARSPALETVRGARSFDALQRSAQVRAHPLLLARYVSNGRTTVRWAFATGRRLGGAVVRNRVRRRLREGARAVTRRVREGWDIMLIARPGSAAATSRELHAAIVDLVRRGGLLKADE
jgi:ribonuclease P protein component